MQITKHQRAILEILRSSARPTAEIDIAYARWVAQESNVHTVKRDDWLEPMTHLIVSGLVDVLESDDKGMPDCYRITAAGFDLITQGE